MQQIYNSIFIIALIILAILLFACLIRAILGPRIGDRLVSVNMMGTIVIVMVCILSLYLNEGYLTDVALCYALLSFLAVVLITKIFSGVYKEKAIKEKIAKDGVSEESRLMEGQDKDA